MRLTKDSVFWWSGGNNMLIYSLRTTLVPLSCGQSMRLLAESTARHTSDGAGMLSSNIYETPQIWHGGIASV